MTDADDAKATRKALAEKGEIPYEVYKNIVLDLRTRAATIESALYRTYGFGNKQALIYRELFRTQKVARDAALEEAAKLANTLEWGSAGLGIARDIRALKSAKP